MQRLWSILNSPSRFAADPYGGLTNQWGHYSAGAAVFLLVCCGWFMLSGEMPLRWPTAAGMILAYAVLIEWRVQGWRGRDSIEDTLFVAMGPLTVAASAVEVSAAWPYSTVVVRLDALAVCIASAMAAVLAYAWGRL